MKKLLMGAMIGLCTVLTGCGYNTIQTKDEQVSSAHAQVLSVYKRRADLIPNLVEVVKGYASHEKQVLMGVAAARASVDKVTLPADATPEQVKMFVDAQKQLGSSVGRLLAVAENYPVLKADANFRDLQRQLEETENQATAARNKYIRSIQGYNTAIRSFPINLTAAVFGYHSKPQLQFEDEKEIRKSPQVKF